MSLEIILWIVGWVVLSEVAFIFSYSMKGEDSLYGWGSFKAYSFFGVGVFMMFQFLIVFWCMEGDCEMISHYIRLLYEAIIITVIAGFFYGNSLISKKIDNSRKKGKKK